jgi:peroxiredoxin
MHKRLMTYLALATTVAGLTVKAEIADRAEAVRPLTIGSRLPDVEVVDAEGVSVSVHQVAAGKPTVFVFYRGGWCSYCNTQLAALADIVPELTAHGVRLAALSPDTPALIAEVEAGADHPYRLYSDSSMAAARAFGVAFQMDEAAFERLKGFGIDIEASSGETHRLLPVPSVFLANAEGEVVFRYHNPDYRERLSAKDLLDAVEAAL